MVRYCVGLFLGLGAIYLGFSKFLFPLFVFFESLFIFFWGVFLGIFFWWLRLILCKICAFFSIFSLFLYLFCYFQGVHNFGSWFSNFFSSFYFILQTFIHNLFEFSVQWRYFFLPLLANLLS